MPIIPGTPVLMIDGKGRSMDDIEAILKGRLQFSF